MTYGDIRYCEEGLPRYRTDKKGYKYANDKTNYYAELKEVENKIKLALRNMDGELSGAVSGVAENR